MPSHLSGAAQRDERVGKLLNIAGIGLFGAVYGRVRWFVRLATAGTGLSVRQIGVHAAKRSRVGVWLAAIFALDAGLSTNFLFLFFSFPFFSFFLSFFLSFKFLFVLFVCFQKLFILCYIDGFFMK